MSKKEKQIIEDLKISVSRCASLYDAKTYEVMVRLSCSLSFLSLGRLEEARFFANRSLELSR